MLLVNVIGIIALYTQAQQPNIILIPADDMRYSDLGCYGSEIQTHKLDRPAQNGMRMTSFYNASRNDPSRASLLTGLYPHQAGAGDMVNHLGHPSYQEYLNNQCVTSAEALQQTGYHTYMAGKWYVGKKDGHWPLHTPTEVITKYGGQYKKDRSKLCREQTAVSPNQKPVTDYTYLSGKGYDETVWWEFRCNKGANKNTWAKIPVPSNWELQGFGEYTYGYDTWNHRKQQPEDYDIGHYRHTFEVPAKWKGKEIELVFGGVMTDTEVRINGKPAGPVHQGGFQQFSYSVASLLNYGTTNTLEVKVSEMSADTSVNAAERQADYWVFGGIYRPVWFEIYPAAHIRHVAVDAKASGVLTCSIETNVQGQAIIKAFVRKNNRVVSPVFTGEVDRKSGEATCQTSLHHPLLWTPETPECYELEVQLWMKNKLCHVVTKKIGFRTIEVKPKDGVYLNGKKIRMKGINRNTFWPESGRTSSESLSIRDVNLIKEMNMNAVRMSHSAPDKHFLEACDSLGLMVINELTGWQDAYATPVGKQLVSELVRRDVNHPSVVMWANGNEGGFNEELIPEYARHDIQQRPVIQPWMLFGGINTRHYISYDYGAAEMFHGQDLFMPTELLHGSYDGGHGAGLEDYWNLMRNHPLSAGGFLWDFCDSGIKRTDQNGQLDAMGDYAADGIVGPYREKEGSFFAVKEIWSPVFIEDKIITSAFDGKLNIENRFDFTNLDQCRFEWKLLKVEDWKHTDSITGVVRPPYLEPGQKGSMQIPLPPGWNTYDALYLCATDPAGREIYTWSYPITSAKQRCQKRITPLLSAEGSIQIEEVNGQWNIKTPAGIVLRIRKNDGTIQGVSTPEGNISLTNGPRLVNSSCALKKVTLSAGQTAGNRLEQKDSTWIDCLFESDSVVYEVKWTIYASGLTRLDYRYHFRKGEQFPLLGVTFDYPEEKVKGARLIGKGPYRVWKNRKRGVTFSVWDKNYNRAVTGERWEYPEFKGFYDGFSALWLRSGEPSIKVYTPTEGLYLHLFTPDKPTKFHKGLTVDAVFPEGNLSFLHGISPISSRVNGTTDKLGPQSAPNFYQAKRNSTGLQGTLYFDFN